MQAHRRLVRRAGLLPGGISEAFLDCGLNIKCRDTTTNTLGQKREDSVFFILQVWWWVSALTETPLGTDTRRFGGASLFYSPFVWECVLHRWPCWVKPWAHAAYLSAHLCGWDQRMSHIMWAAGSQFGGSSFFLTLLFPGLLSHHNQKPAESIMRGQAEGTCWARVSWLVSVCGLWDDPRSMKVWFSIAPIKK